MSETKEYKDLKTEDPAYGEMASYIQATVLPQTVEEAIIQSLRATANNKGSAEDVMKIVDAEFKKGTKLIDKFIADKDKLGTDKETFVKDYMDGFKKRFDGAMKIRGLEFKLGLKESKGGELTTDDAEIVIVSTDAVVPSYVGKKVKFKVEMPNPTNPSEMNEREVTGKVESDQKGVLQIVYGDDKPVTTFLPKFWVELV